MNVYVPNVHAFYIKNYFMCKKFFYISIVFYEFFMRLINLRNPEFL